MAIDRAFPCCSGDRSYDRDHPGDPVPGASTVGAPTLAAPTSLSELPTVSTVVLFQRADVHRGSRCPGRWPGGVSRPETSPSSRRRRARGVGKEPARETAARSLVTSAINCRVPPTRKRHVAPKAHGLAALALASWFHP